MRKNIIAALAAVATLACGGGGDGPAAPTPASLSIRLAADTVRPGALLQVALVNGVATQDSVQGTLGGAPLVLARTGDSTLVVLVPDVAAGSQTLELRIGTASPRIAVTVLPGLSIADPAGSIGAALDAQVAAVPAAAPLGFDATVWAARRATLDSLVADAKQRVAALPAADQLALARMLASVTPAVAAPDLQPSFAATGSLMSTSTFNWKDAECRNAMRAFSITGLAALYSAGSLAFFLIVPPVNPLLKAAGVVTSAAAFAGTMLLALDDFAVVGNSCFIQKAVALSETDLTAATLSGALVSTRAATTMRFFKGRAVLYYPNGDFRPLSRDEISVDATVANLASVLDRLYATTAKALGLLPSGLRSSLPAAPPRLSQKAPQPTTKLAVTPAEVRIENVSPSSVALAVSASGNAVTLTPGATVTADVPFTYDVVSVADPSVKTTMSGVLRPFMAATMTADKTTITGQRSTFVGSDGLTYGKLTCSMNWTAHVTGGDTATWEDFSWNQAGDGTNSAVEQIRNADGSRMIFESGDYPFYGTWYWTANVNGQPQYLPFSVTLTVTYTDLLTGEKKSAGTSTVNCQ